MKVFRNDDGTIDRDALRIAMAGAIGSVIYFGAIIVFTMLAVRAR